MHARIVCLLVSCLALATGCSSISDSISSPFESSSASSRSLEGSQAAFRRDVEQYTATFARSNGDLSLFSKGVGDLAARRGITNWQSDPGTFTAIGRGLRDAGADRGQLEAYVVNIARGDAAMADAIRKGYQGN